MNQIGKGFLTAIGALLASVGAAVSAFPDPNAALAGKILMVVGAVIVFAAQTLYDAGLIPELRAPRKLQLGKALLTAIGVFVANIGASLLGAGDPGKIGTWLIAIGAIIVFAAQALYDAGLIPEAKRKH
jgi:hypothetical protein